MGIHKTDYLVDEETEFISNQIGGFWYHTDKEFIFEHIFINVTMEEGFSNSNITSARYGYSIGIQLLTF